MGQAVCQKRPLQVQRINEEDKIRYFNARYTFHVDEKTQLQIKNHMTTDIAMWSDSM